MLVLLLAFLKGSTALNFRDLEGSTALKRLKCRFNPPACCKAFTASCLACSKCMSVEEYCKRKPDTPGCPEKKPCPKKCCRAFTATCLACSKCTSVEEFCKMKPDTPGCPEEKPCPEVCCEAETASCMACKECTTVEKFCKKNPEVDGCPEKKCPEICCQAEIASCMACKQCTTVEKFCEKHSGVNGCPATPVTTTEEERACSDVLGANWKAEVMASNGNEAVSSVWTPDFESRCPFFCNPFSPFKKCPCGAGRFCGLFPPEKDFEDGDLNCYAMGGWSKNGVSTYTGATGETCSYCYCNGD